ncbi:MAG TPA: 2'-5' RNA ligase family protein [Ramlibacter sp.]|nr:2'-5' RNA ligase family protein [Ramlibacter sp.]
MSRTPPDGSFDTDALAARYDAMWAEAAPLVRDGGAELDPWLSLPAEDARRGVTLLARPAPAVAAALAAFLGQLRALEPEQYYQPQAELHHTVLSLFTATADYAPHLENLPEYRAAVADAIAGMPPFTIAVSGVTLACGAVLAQGFPQDGTLAAMRERLREALGARGLGGALDRRYRLETAHMTLVRFAAPLRDAARFVNALAAARAIDFGVSEVDELELVLGDWYHTTERERELARYPLVR